MPLSAGFIQFIVGPSYDLCGDMFEIVLSHPPPASSMTPASAKMVQSAASNADSVVDGENKSDDKLKSTSSKHIRVWAEHLTENKKNWKLESAKNG